MVDPHRLRVFRAVVQTGSINRAATRLGYTPSAVSQHVSALQRETGLALIEKRGRGIAPTSAGIAVADRAARVLDQLADFDSLADDLRSGRSGTLRITCFSSSNRAWMPAIAATLVREFPDLRLELALTELGGPHAGEPDVELYVAESVRGDRDPSVADGTADGYDIEHLRTEGYVVVVPAAHALAMRGSVSLAELADEPWIDNDHARGPCREIVLSACAEQGFAPRFRIQAPDYTTAIDYVAAGVGVTVLPKLGALGMPDGVVVIPVDDAAARRRIMMRVKRSMRMHPAVQRLTELLRTAALA
ncbi:LysR family transcriptional regulator [Agromyces badenianii]|uniref:LysR family transcriptional regulator n=1 Tax=Agromyces badenianii TaxID=2080742 RepID=A0A2S0WXB2_9MICO|nr:LysR family transcriptional regulator [Agromyces badenianii]AWB95844.1 LysR family transcriptional regulator [Agromyces badenianii]